MTTIRRPNPAPRSLAGVKSSASPVLSILGADSFAEFAAVKSGGAIIWCNFDLARQLGFAVPRANQLTEDLENQLLAALSFRTAENADAGASGETITMYADRYGGEGVRPALGAGRAGFLPYGNLYVKGIGLTPLFKHNNPDDFVHSHGAVYLSDCLTEALFGEVNHNLFTLGSTRAVAIIDQGRHVIDPFGKRIPVALLVRTGAQLRPAHLLVNHLPPGGSALLEKFVSIARATRQLVTRQCESTKSEIPDIRATLLQIIDDQAQTAADGFRWRLIHGAISSSNMEMSGAMLDLPTQSAQPRTAPILLLDYANWGFGAEHRERALQLIPAYRKLVRDTPLLLRRRFNIKWLDIVKEMEKAYARHLPVKLLSACGLKTGIARQIYIQHRELANQLAAILLELAALKNPGSVLVAKSVVEHVSVVDIFHLLQHLPAIYFAHPEADHRQDIFRLLKPIFKGNRFQVAGKRAAVESLAGKFADCYRELIEVCAALAPDFYGDLETMRSSMTARAAFENEPLEALYYRRLHVDLDKVIAAYEGNDNAVSIGQAIDQRICASLRRVDALLAQGDSLPLPKNGLELERRTIDGINYCVKAWNDAWQTRRLGVSISARRGNRHYLTTVARLPGLSKRQLQALCYRFTVDGGRSFAEVRASVLQKQSEDLLITFEDICDLPLVGRLEGAFYVRQTGAGERRVSTPYFSGYVFAIPDPKELLGMLARHT